MKRISLKEIWDRRPWRRLLTHRSRHQRHLPLVNVGDCFCTRGGQGDRVYRVVEVDKLPSLPIHVRLRANDGQEKTVALWMLQNKHFFIPYKEKAGSFASLPRGMIKGF